MEGEELLLQVFCCRTGDEAGVVVLGTQGQERICRQPTCFHGRSSPWLARDAS